MPYYPKPAYRRSFHCAKCGLEDDKPYTLQLAGAGKVCYSCFQTGNKDDPRRLATIAKIKAAQQRNRRVGIEGAGLARFV